MSIVDIALQGGAAQDGQSLRKVISRLAVDKLASSTPPRPLPMSLWSPIDQPADPDRQGPVCDYVTWPGLTDRTYSSRHLPPAAQADIDALPPNPQADPVTGAPGPVTALFLRPPGGLQKDRSSVLFAYFAQWFTDSFLRTSSPDRRRNTSNHAIDLCQIYGLTEAVTNLLRAKVGGKLRSQVVRDEEFPDTLFTVDDTGALVPKDQYRALPQVASGALDWILDQQNLSPERRARIYATGLERGNSSIGYVTISTLFLREHNRLCDGLAARNPSWDDERLFQTARMINTVLLLRIVVEDYINHIAGHRIFLLDNGYAEAQPWYRTNWMAVEFDLLYRWHGLIPESVLIAGQAYGPQDFQTNNGLLETLGIEALIDGASREQAGRVGLFNVPVFMAAAEYQSLKMGRDFRLRGFNDYRERFGLERLADWDALTDDGRVQAALKALYRDVDQIELVVGLFAEQAKGGALFGALMNTMVACDAFTQALTNPLLAKSIYNADTFTPYGLDAIAATPTLQALVDRNVLDGAQVKATFDF